MIRGPLPPSASRSEMNNQIRTGLYLIFLTALVIIMGSTLGGRQGLLLAFFFASGMIWISYFYSDQVVLWTYGAKLVEGPDPYGLQKIVSKLAEKAEIPKPSVYIIPS